MTTQKIKEALERLEKFWTGQYWKAVTHEDCVQITQSFDSAMSALAALSMPQEAVAWQNTGDPQWIKVGGSAPDDENWTALVYASPLPQAAQVSQQAINRAWMTFTEKRSTKEAFAETIRALSSNPAAGRDGELVSRTDDFGTVWHVTKEKAAEIDAAIAKDKT